MGRLQEYRNEFQENGIVGVAKRLLFLFPNRWVIRRNRKSALRYGLNRTKQREQKVIVSLTSYPERFDTIYQSLKSLLLQDEQPDRIIVWFGSDTTIRDLPEDVLSLREYGIEFRFDSVRNLKPHKKYFYAMQEFPDDIIITVDDDCVYPPSTISTLLKSYQKHPNAVSARRVHLMTFDGNGALNAYRKWRYEYRGCKKEMHSLLAVGVGGILYPPHLFDERAFDVERIQSLCLGADDIWLKFMELLNGVKVVWTPCFFAHPPALASKSSLGQQNVKAGKNDEYIGNMLKNYNITLKPGS